jgi:hypothetical protein
MELMSTITTSETNIVTPIALPVTLPVDTHVSNIETDVTKTEKVIDFIINFIKNSGKTVITTSLLQEDYDYFLDHLVTTDLNGDHINNDINDDSTSKEPSSYFPHSIDSRIKSTMEHYIVTSKLKDNIKLLHTVCHLYKDRCPIIAEYDGTVYMIIFHLENRSKMIDISIVRSLEFAKNLYRSPKVKMLETLAGSIVASYNITIHYLMSIFIDKIYVSALFTNFMKTRMNNKCDSVNGMYFSTVMNEILKPTNLYIKYEKDGSKLELPYNNDNFIGKQYYFTVYNEIKNENGFGYKMNFIKGFVLRETDNILEFYNMKVVGPTVPAVPTVPAAIGPIVSGQMGPICHAVMGPTVLMGSIVSGQMGPICPPVMGPIVSGHMGPIVSGHMGPVGPIVQVKPTKVNKLTKLIDDPKCERVIDYIVSNIKNMDPTKRRTITPLQLEDVKYFLSRKVFTKPYINPYKNAIRIKTEIEEYIKEQSSSEQLNGNNIKLHTVNHLQKNTSHIIAECNNNVSIWYIYFDQPTKTMDFMDLIKCRTLQCALGVFNTTEMMMFQQLVNTIMCKRNTNINDCHNNIINGVSFSSLFTKFMETKMNDNLDSVNGRFFADAVNQILNRSNLHIMYEKKSNIYKDIASGTKYQESGKYYYFTMYNVVPGKLTSYSLNTSFFLRESGDILEFVQVKNNISNTTATPTIATTTTPTTTPTTTYDKLINKLEVINKNAKQLIDKHMNSYLNTLLGYEQHTLAFNNLLRQVRSSILDIKKLESNDIIRLEEEYYNIINSVVAKHDAAKHDKCTALYQSYINYIETMKTINANILNKAKCNDQQTLHKIKIMLLLIDNGGY